MADDRKLTIIAEAVLNDRASGEFDRNIARMRADGARGVEIKTTINRASYAAARADIRRLREEAEREITIRVKGAPVTPGGAPGSPGPTHAERLVEQRERAAQRVRLENLRALHQQSLNDSNARHQLDLARIRAISRARADSERTTRHSTSVSGSVLGRHISANRDVDIIRILAGAAGGAGGGAGAGAGAAGRAGGFGSRSASGALRIPLTGVSLGARLGPAGIAAAGTAAMVMVAAIIKAVVAASAAVIALAGSISSALVGALAVGTSAAAAFGVGLVSAFAVLKPIIGDIGAAKDALTKFNDAKKMFGADSGEARQAKEDMGDLRNRIGARPFAVAAKQRSIGDKFRSLIKPSRNDAYDTILAGLDGVEKRVPRFARIVNTSFRGLTRGVRDFGKTLGDKESLGIFENLGRTFSKMIGPTLRGLANILKAVLRVADAGRPMAEGAAKGFERWSKALLRGSQDGEKLRDKVERLWQHTKDWASALSSAVGFVKAIFGAGAEDGRSMAKSFKQFFDDQTAWAKSPEGRAKLAEFFRKGREFFEFILDVLPDLVDALVSIANAFDDTVEFAKAFAAALGEAWDYVKQIKDVSLGDIFGGIDSGLDATIGQIPGIKQATSFVEGVFARGGRVEGYGAHDSKTVRAAPGEVFLTKHHVRSVERAAPGLLGRILGGPARAHWMPVQAMANGGEVSSNQVARHIDRIEGRSDKTAARIKRIQNLIDALERQAERSRPQEPKYREVASNATRRETLAINEANKKARTGYEARLAAFDAGYKRKREAYDAQLRGLNALQDSRDTRRNKAQDKLDKLTSPVVPGSEKFGDQELSYESMLSRAKGTKGIGDDNAARERGIEIYSSRLRYLNSIAPKHKNWKEMRRAIAEEANQVRNKLNQLKDDRSDAKGEKESNATEQAITDIEIGVQKAVANNNEDDPTTYADDLVALAAGRDYFTKIVGQIGAKLATTKDPGAKLDLSKQYLSAMNDQQSYTDQIKSLEDITSGGAALAKQAAFADQVSGAYNALRGLGSNIRPGSGAAGLGGGAAPRSGGVVNVTNHFAVPPVDNLAWAKSMKRQTENAWAVSGP